MSQFTNALIVLYPGRDSFWYMQVERLAFKAGKKSFRGVIKWLVDNGFKPEPNWMTSNRAVCKVSVDGVWYIVARNAEVQACKGNRGMALDVEIVNREYTKCTPYEPEAHCKFPADTVIVAYRWWTEYQIRVMTNKGIFTCDEDGVVIS